MRQGDKVRVIIGKHKGKSAIIIGTIPMTDMTTGQKPITMEGKAAGLCVVQFDDGTEETLEESEVEIIPIE